MVNLNNDLGNFIEYKSLGTINNSTDAANFINRYGLNTDKPKGIRLGNYVTINTNAGYHDNRWMYIGHDIKYNVGDTPLTSHHGGFIPYTYLLNSVMNSSNTTEGGFVGSKMFTETLPSIDTHLKNVLGSHILKWKALLSNSVNNDMNSMAGANWKGAANNWTWTDVYSCLLTEVEVYGSTVLSSSLYDTGDGCHILPYFSFTNHTSTEERFSFWLRCVTGSTYFALADGNGIAGGSNASNSRGVRPLILLG